MRRRRAGYYLVLSAWSFALALLPVLLAAPRLHEVGASGLPGWVGVAGFTILGCGSASVGVRRALVRRRSVGA